MTETMPAPAEPLAEIEVGLTIEQAQAIVDEIAMLHAHANHEGKKCVRMLYVLSNTLIRALADKCDQRETNP